jgi:membrane protein DedA with SNARE-associated domain
MLSAVPVLSELAGLSGYTLIAAICALLIVEEIGVPLFFAPGDLLLIVSGATIPAAHLNAVAVVAATTSSVLIGALAGRELFARWGAGLLSRIASSLGARSRLEQLSTRLRRGGPPAIFVGRITPGLRVHTTEAAGLVRMRRATFVAGLVPAVALYDGVFTGLGAWKGQSVWSMVQAYSPPPALVFGVLVGVVALLLTPPVVRSLRGRAPRRHSHKEI